MVVLGFAFFHSKGNTKENIFYDVENIVDIPVILRLLFCEVACIEE